MLALLIVQVLILDHLDGHSSASLGDGITTFSHCHGSIECGLICTVLLLLVTLIAIACLLIFNQVLLMLLLSTIAPTVGAPATKQSATALLSRVWQALRVIISAIASHHTLLSRASRQSDTFRNVSRVVRQNLDVGVVGEQDALLLELVKVPETRESLLAERQEANVVHGAAALANEERVFLQGEFVLARCEVVAALFVHEHVSRCQVADHVPFAPLEVVHLLFGEALVRILQVVLGHGPIAAQRALRDAGATRRVSHLLFCGSKQTHT